MPLVFRDNQVLKVHLVLRAEVDNLEMLDLRDHPGCQVQTGLQAVLVNQELEEPLVLLEDQVPQEMLVSRVSKDPKVPRGRLEVLEHLEQLEIQDHREVKDHKDQLDHLDLRASKDQKEPLEPRELKAIKETLASLEHQAQLDNPERLEPKVPLDSLDKQDHKVHQDHPDSRVLRAKPVISEFKAIKDQLVNLASLAHQVQTAHQALRDLPVKLDLPDNKETRVNKDPKGHQVCPVIMVSLVHQDRLAVQVHKEQLDPLDRLVT